MGQIANLQFLNQKKIRVSTRLLIDVPLIIVVFMLVMIGLVFVYSASWSFSIQAFDNAAYMVSKQAVWLFLGIAAALIMGFLIPYRWLQPLSPYLLIGTMVSLLILLLIPAGPALREPFSAARFNRPKSLKSRLLSIWPRCIRNAPSSSEPAASARSNRLLSRQSAPCLSWSSRTSAPRLRFSRFPR